MNWGYKITLGIGVFIAIIMTMVVYSMQQDIHLVSKTYYEEEIAYQGQIDKMQNLLTLADKPEIAYNDRQQEISILFPEHVASNAISGKVHLFRPSDGRLDQHFILNLDDTGNHNIDSKNLIPGLWRVKMTWNSKGQEYFTEEKLYIQ